MTKILKNFWKNEFGRAGNYQIVKMVSGVTARIGRFLFSPTAKRILEQPHSTINFDDILASGKILICNVGEGKSGGRYLATFGNHDDCQNPTSSDASGKDKTTRSHSLLSLYR